MQKFQGKYRIESARAKWWDYRNAGDYFITICTKNRQHLFGHIQDGEMILNDYGKIVTQCWFDLPDHYDNIYLGPFQIMPNHIHCIVGVLESELHSVETGFKPVCTCTNPVCTSANPVCTSANPACVESINNVESNNTDENSVDSISVDNPDKEKKVHGVFEFMRALKTFSSRKINEKRNSEGVSNWHSRFHDHIIRNEAEYNRIANYIINNPKNWKEDCFFNKNT